MWCTRKDVTTYLITRSHSPVGSFQLDFRRKGEKNEEKKAKKGLLSPPTPGDGNFWLKNVNFMLKESPETEEKEKFIRTTEEKFCVLSSCHLSHARRHRKEGARREKKEREEDKKEQKIAFSSCQIRHPWCLPTERQLGSAFRSSFTLHKHAKKFTVRTARPTMDGCCLWLNLVASSSLREANKCVRRVLSIISRCRRLRIRLIFSFPRPSIQGLRLTLTSGKFKSRARVCRWKPPQPPPLAISQHTRRNHSRLSRTKQHHKNNAH